MKMQAKDVQKVSDNYDKVLEAVHLVSEPVRNTIGPKGGNVILETPNGVFVTNDGVTIAKEVYAEDPLQNAILTIVKQSALRTNTEAGDGTSTTVLLGSILIENGIQQMRSGVHHKTITGKYEEYSKHIIEELKKKAIPVKTDKDKMKIAQISANNDTVIAEDTVRIFNSAGIDGRVVLEPSTTGETEIKEEIGFFMNDGFFDRVLINSQDGTAHVKNAAVFITNRKLYYEEEAETILKWCLKNKHDNLVIVAKDFVGKALPAFLANHRSTKNPALNIVLIKNSGDDDVFDDLAAYLSGTVVRVERGKIVDTGNKPVLTDNDFCVVKEVIAFADRTLFKDSMKKQTKPKRLKERISYLKKQEKEMQEGEAKEKLKSRIAALTSGIVTVRVGGSTPVEMAERIYRYEDAISAVRSAAKYGYLPGGGVALMRAHRSLISKNPAFDEEVFSEFSTANIKQVAENAGQQGGKVLREIERSVHDDYGYNAQTDKYERFISSGVVDPYYAEELAIKNSVSIANAILGSRFIITEIKDYGEDK